MSIFVTQSFLPPREEYDRLLNEIWETHWLTNNGPILQRLENEIRAFIQNPNLLFVGNGTIAIQLAIKALDLKGQIITTPYSYCATTTSIIWENCQPVFVDIYEHDLNINADLIEQQITDKTSAILATHVYGNPCNLEKIEALGEKYQLPIIYDAAHAFGVKVGATSLLNFGDIATCSFHATKVFHTIEGGAVVCKKRELFDKITHFRSFGHVNDDYFSVGINAKNSEFHAAMGLAILPHLTANIAKRKAVFELYDDRLNFDRITRPYSKCAELEYNYAYYPILFENEAITKKVIASLKDNDIFPRRYFYPSLNTLPYLQNKMDCPVSESVVQRVLSLPLHPDLSPEIIIQIANIINQNL